MKKFSILAILLLFFTTGCSFFEKEKNYLLAKISLVAAGMLLLIWLFMIIIAL